MIDLGIQPQRAFNGEDKKPAHEVYFTFELCDTFMVDKDGNEVLDKPRWVSTSIPLHPLVADRAKSTKLADALDSKRELNGDFARMVGFPVNVSVTSTPKGDKVYTNIVGFTEMRARDAAKLEELKNPPKVFDLDDPDLEVFNALPQWLQDKIKGNLGYERSILQGLLGDEGNPKEEHEEKAEAQPEPSSSDDEDAPW